LETHRLYISLSYGSKPPGLFICSFFRIQPVLVFDGSLVQLSRGQIVLPGRRAIQKI
jgi:hypothetical protein